MPQYEGCGSGFSVEKAARIAITAHKEGSTLRDAALTLSYVTGAEFDE